MKGVIYLFSHAEASETKKNYKKNKAGRKKIFLHSGISFRVVVSSFFLYCYNISKYDDGIYRATGEEYI